MIINAFLTGAVPDDGLRYQVAAVSNTGADPVYIGPTVSYNDLTIAGYHNLYYPRGTDLMNPAADYYIGVFVIDTSTNTIPINTYLNGHNLSLSLVTITI
jgi:hypothetical protein